MLQRFALKPKTFESVALQHFQKFWVWYIWDKNPKGKGAHSAPFPFGDQDSLSEFFD
jgi:hypothetical protein